MFKKRANTYWTIDEERAAVDAETLQDLIYLALAVLGRMPSDAVLMCGLPADVVRRRARQGLSVFNLDPFARHLNRLGFTHQDLYEPLLATGLIKRLYLPHDWDLDPALDWLYHRAEQLNIHTMVLEEPST